VLCDLENGAHTVPILQPALRQMVYLVIKELAKVAEDVLMVTSSIMKDMQPNLEVIYRPNAIRAVCRVIDVRFSNQPRLVRMRFTHLCSLMQGSMIQGVERFFKAAIVDRNSSISSAALVSSYHLHPIAKDVIKRWANEAQEALNAKSSGASFTGSSSSGFMSAYGGSSSSSSQQSGYQAFQSTSYITQYHALGLLYSIRHQDRMAITKLIQQLSGSNATTARGAASALRNANATCMLIRYAAKVMEDDPK
jgi:coatomer protein complex subunit gamma